jgi:hypothetical protein
VRLNAETYRPLGGEFLVKRLSAREREVQDLCDRAETSDRELAATAFSLDQRREASGRIGCDRRATLETWVRDFCATFRENDVEQEA